MLHSGWGLGWTRRHVATDRLASDCSLAVWGELKGHPVAKLEAGLGEATAWAEGKGLLTTLWRSGPRGQAGVDSLTRQSQDQIEVKPRSLVWGRAGGSWVSQGGHRMGGPGQAGNSGSLTQPPEDLLA